jgi:hypothetical protein
MDRKDFVLHRVAFAGLPYGALREVEAAHGSPYAWRKGMLRQARQMRARARQALDSGAAASAAQYFRWAGVAYHGATLGPDLAELDELPRVSRLRGLAVAAYRSALRQDPSCRSLALDDGTGRVAGYCRWPDRSPRGVVVLLNGLDSLCEVELHAFGTGLLERGVAALSLDLPARFSSTGRPDMQIERLLPPLRRWLSAHDLGRLPLGAFGVSFGGYLAAGMDRRPAPPAPVLLSHVQLELPHRGAGRSGACGRHRHVERPGRAGRPHAPVRDDRGPALRPRPHPGLRPLGRIACGRAYRAGRARGNQQLPPVAAGCL